MWDVQVVCDGVQGEVHPLVLGAVVVLGEVQQGSCFCGVVPLFCGGVPFQIGCGTGGTGWNSRITLVAEAVNESPCLGGQCNVERVVRLAAKVAENEFTFGNLLDNCITLLENCKA